MKRIATYFLLSVIVITSIYSETIFIEEPVTINANPNSADVVRELLKLEMENRGYTVVDSLRQDVEVLSSRIIRLDEERARIILSLENDQSEIKRADAVITVEDKLDIFIERLVKMRIEGKYMKETKEYGKTVAEEEVLSNLEEPFRSKFEIDVGMHLGTQQLDPNIDISYIPGYLGMGISMYKPDYALHFRTESFIQGLGLRIGMSRLLSRDVNTGYIGGDAGLAFYYGTTENAVSYPYLGPFVSIFGGGIFSRTSSIYIKPELRLTMSLKKPASSGTDFDLVVGANAYITLGF